MAASHLVIPDTQVKSGVPTYHLEWIGRYINDRRPDVIIQIGDFADVESLSSYDRGNRAFEGRRYRKDVDASRRAMEKLVNPFQKGGYRPRLVLTLGNHEQRIERAVEQSAELEGTISVKDFGYEDYGFEVHNFLEVVTIDGIDYSHFFPRASTGKVVQTRVGAPSAKAQLVRNGRSCTAGHAQGVDIACLPLSGRLQWGLIAGSCYLHDESYLSPQGNQHWRGIILKQGVNRGAYSPILVDLDYLRRRYSSHERSRKVRNIHN
jgi:hypothetical protein